MTMKGFVRRTSVAASVAVFAMMAAGCTKPVPPVASPSEGSSASSPDSPVSASSVTPAPGPRQAGRARIDNTQVVAGASCKGYGRAFSASHGAPVFTRDGDVFTSQEIRSGGGCPKRPVFTLAYEPKTEAGKTVLLAHVCEDPEADSCEMMMTGKISFDLGTALSATHASDVRVVDP
jgi:hypothetical protein